MVNLDVNLYEVLDLTPDASPQEIRSAYLQAKSTYSKDNPVLYTLVTTEDRERTLRRVEEAYLTLSDPERRRQYDKSHGLIQPLEDSLFNSSRDGSGLSQDSPGAALEGSGESISNDDLLIPPTTDFEYTSTEPEVQTRALPAESPVSFQLQQQTQTHPLPQPQTPLQSHPQPSAILPNAANQDMPLNEIIDQEVEWKGTTLKSIREIQHISLEEMSEITKISKNILNGYRK